MIYINQIKRRYWVSVFSLFCHSATFLLMPFATNNAESNKLLLLIIGLLFWISLIVGYFSLFVANKKRKYFINRKLGGNTSMDCNIGLITFFSSVPATVFDSMMFASIIALIIIYFTGAINHYRTYVMISILVFSLNMHCLFNGRIYKITKYRRVRRENDYE